MNSNLNRVILLHGVTWIVHIVKYLLSTKSCQCPISIPLENVSFLMFSGDIEMGYRRKIG